MTYRKKALYLANLLITLCLAFTLLFALNANSSTSNPTASQKWDSIELDSDQLLIQVVIRIEWGLENQERSLTEHQSSLIVNLNKDFEIRSDQGFAFQFKAKPTLISENSIQFDMDVNIEDDESFQPVIVMKNPGEASVVIGNKTSTRFEAKIDILR